MSKRGNYIISTKKMQYVRELESQGWARAKAARYVRRELEAVVASCRKYARSEADFQDGINSIFGVAKVKETIAIAPFAQMLWEKRRNRAVFSSGLVIHSTNTPPNGEVMAAARHFDEAPRSSADSDGGEEGPDAKAFFPPCRDWSSLLKKWLQSAPFLLSERGDNR